MTNEERRQFMRSFRAKVRLYTGLAAHEYAALPKAARRAVREYVEHADAPRSPHGGMYGLIREQFGFVWQEKP